MKIESLCAYDELIAKTENVDTSVEEFFLCFGFRGHSDLRNFHVTLSYLGKPSTWNINEVKKMVDHHLKNNGQDICSFSILFNRPAMFGFDNSIRVLLPSYEDKEFTDVLFLKDLWRDCKAFRNHDFPFNPHMTTELGSFMGVVDKLYLCGRSYKVYKEWKL
jgi:2'-5' RNA ligase